MDSLSANINGHDWQICKDDDCEECQSLVDEGIIISCDGCGSPGHTDSLGWEGILDGNGDVWFTVFIALIIYN